MSSEQLSAAPLPFRTDHRSVGAEELKRAGALPEAEERLELELWGCTSREALLRLLRHPDDRVPLHLLREWIAKPHRFPSALVAEREMVDILLQRARQEGVLWTPLLDALAMSGYWPQRNASGEVEGEECSHEAWLIPLAEYLEREEEPEVFRSLLTFQTPLLIDLVRRHAKELDSAQVITWAEEPAALPSLAANPRLSERQRMLVLLRALEGTLQGSPPAGEALRLLSESGFVIPTELFQRLYSEPLRERGVPPDGPHPLHRTQRELLGYRPLTAEQFAEIVSSMDRRGGSTLWSAVARHPHATLQHWRLALQYGGEFSEVTLALARNREARQVPEIRAALIQASMRNYGPDFQLLLTMSEVLTRQELAPHLPLLLSHRPSDAAKWLAEGTLPAWLTAADLAPFCASGEAFLRLAAIQAVGRLEEANRTSSLAEPTATSRPRL